MKTKNIENKEEIALKHEINLRKITYAIWEMKEYSYQWKKTIKARFEENNGDYIIRQIRNRFNYMIIFKEVKRHHNLDDIYLIVKKAYNV